MPRISGYSATILRMVCKIFGSGAPPISEFLVSFSTRSPAIRINTATASPITGSAYGRAASGKISAARLASNTAPVAIASDRLSAEVARKTSESSFFPHLRLKKHIHNLQSTEPPSTAKVSTSGVTGTGEISFFTELLTSSAPTRSTKKEIIMEAMYSMRACPYGCPRSAGLAEMRKETREITEEPASERLLTASARTESEPQSTPTVNFAANSRRFIRMPTTAESVPATRRTAGSFTSSGSRTKRRKTRRNIRKPPFKILKH